AHRSLSAGPGRKCRHDPQAGRLSRCAARHHRALRLRLFGPGVEARRYGLCRDRPGDPAPELGCVRGGEAGPARVDDHPRSRSPAPGSLRNGRRASAWLGKLGRAGGGPRGGRSSRPDTPGGGHAILEHRGGRGHRACRSFATDRRVARM
ncbi:MAG: tRNA (cytidine(34)-2'-O)-methyltransferase, partial [uncultured Sphingosinicella sp.]